MALSGNPAGGAGLPMSATGAANSAPAVDPALSFASYEIKLQAGIAGVLLVAGATTVVLQQQPNVRLAA